MLFRVVTGKWMLDRHEIVRKVHDLLKLYNEVDVTPECLLFKIPETWQISTIKISLQLLTTGQLKNVHHKALLVPVLSRPKSINHGVLEHFLYAAVKALDLDV
ncbi:hypothetical protein Tsubulata_007364 [Turnera subulata]|nr:hypothetical protein Tsubulata_007364 [Turnera subulata]